MDVSPAAAVPVSPLVPAAAEEPPVAVAPPVGAPSEALAPFGAVEVEPPAAGTAAVDAAPSEVAAAARRAAGTAAVASGPPADAEAVQPAAGPEAVGSAAEVAERRQAVAQPSVAEAVPDGRVLPPAQTAQQSPAARRATQNRAVRRVSGLASPDAHLEDVHLDLAAVRSDREPARCSAAGGLPVWAVHPVLQLEFAPAAHCPAEDYPAGRRRAADPAPVVPIPAFPDGHHRRRLEERPAEPSPCPDG